jgi:hypothetical protein
MDNSLPSGMDSDRAFYSANFMDLDVWEPFVRHVCLQHGLGYLHIDPGVPGTFPTFMVELDPDSSQTPYQSVVVKFFGPLFDGAGSFGFEKELGHWLSRNSLPIRSPAILAVGQLAPSWSYLIFEGIPGVSIGRVRTQLSESAWMCVAAQMGSFMKILHTLTATGLPVNQAKHVDLSWDGFASFLKAQAACCTANHLQWGDLPPHLVAHIENYLMPLEMLLDLASPPHLIHADLTADHVLGKLVERSHAILDDAPSTPTSCDWESLAIIDWGDARMGNILYELVAVHVDLFLADTHLLRTCLETYGLSDFYRQDFARKALCMVLLHQFPMPAWIYAPYMQVQNLNELAQGLFGM